MVRCIDWVHRDSHQRYLLFIGVLQQKIEASKIWIYQIYHYSTKCEQKMRNFLGTPMAWPSQSLRHDHLLLAEQGALAPQVD